MTSTVARQDDGTVQITLTVPWGKLQKKMESQALEMGKTIEIAGFRKGKAPLDKLMAQISKDTLVEKTLQGILPQAFGEAVREHKIRPAMYPKFEIIKAEEGKDWQIRAITCEVAEIKLGDYKKVIGGALRTKKIWTPGKAESEEKRELSRDEKEQAVMEELLKTVKVKLPKILVKQEVETKLSILLERLEKLGLSLESYLSSINKTPEKLRGEYEKQASDSIKLELILTKIAEEENVKVDKEEIEKFIEAAKGDPKLGKQLERPEQKRIVEMILRKRKVIDFLVSLA